MLIQGGVLGVECQTTFNSFVLVTMTGSRDPSQDITWDDSTKHGNEKQTHGDC